MHSSSKNSGLYFQPKLGNMKIMFNTDKRLIIPLDEISKSKRYRRERERERERYFVQETGYSQWKGKLQDRILNSCKIHLASLWMEQNQFSLHDILEMVFVTEEEILEGQELGKLLLDLYLSIVTHKLCYIVHFLLYQYMYSHNYLKAYPTVGWLMLEGEQATSRGKMGKRWAEYSPLYFVSVKRTNQNNNFIRYIHSVTFSKLTKSQSRFRRWIYLFRIPQRSTQTYRQYICCCFPITNIIK